jgi:hypothetical protein
MLLIWDHQFHSLGLLRSRKELYESHGARIQTSLIQFGLLLDLLRYSFVQLQSLPLKIEGVWLLKDSTQKNPGFYVLSLKHLHPLVMVLRITFGLDYRLSSDYKPGLIG